MFIGIFVLLATKPAYISAHMCVFVETALQVGEGEREIPDCHKASIHLSTHVERERESRESERASETERFLIATKPACISAQADIVLARALASLTGITHQCTRVHAHTRMYMFNKHAVFIVYYGAERN